jgi:hypothetical protein
MINMKPNIERRLFLTGVAAAALSACNPASASTSKGQARYASSPVRKLTDAQWKARLSPAAYRVLRHEDTERAGTSPLKAESGAGLRLRRLRPAAVQVRMEVRERHRLAQLLQRDQGKHRDQARPDPADAADRVPLRPLPGPPGPHLRRRPKAHRPALLQQRRGAEVRPGLRPVARIESP